MKEYSKYSQILHNCVTHDFQRINFVINIIIFQKCRGLLFGPLCMRKLKVQQCDVYGDHNYEAHAQ